MALFGRTPPDTADMAARRRRMVDQQLRGRDVQDTRVLEVMGRIPREEFVLPEDRAAAYEDRPLPVGHGATISQPFIVALMTEALSLAASHRVLEVGTGSGYQAAILAELAGHVCSVEIVAPLANAAEARLRRLGYRNIAIRRGDGYRGWEENAPYHAIVVTAAPPRVPDPLLQQLAPGGRMVLPVGRDDQELLVVERSEGGFERRRLIPVRFVPMTGEAQE